MQTLNRLVYEVRNIYKLYADDSQITNRIIAQYIKETRAKLLEEDLSKGKIISDEFIQYLPCVEFESYAYGDACCDDDYEFDICLSRSVEKLPVTIQRNNKNMIVAVQSVDMRKDYSETTFYRAKYNGNNRFTGHTVRWYLLDGYMYLTNTNEIERLSVTGIFEDPEELTSFTTCTGTSCFNWDGVYPITSGMAKRVVDIVLKDRLNLTYQLKEDEINNAKDDTSRKG